MPDLPTFPEFASRLVLDSGELLQLEPFQLAFVDDVAAGHPECWLIIPEGNGKTTLLAAFLLWHAQVVRFASVPVAASTRDQAMLLYRQAKGFVMRSQLPGFQCQDGYRRIKYGKHESVIQIFAADAGGGDGVIPTLAVIDEPHRQKNMDLYLTWSGKLGKRAAQLVAISTAGEPGSEFEQIRETIRQAATEVSADGCFSRYVSNGVVLHEWAVPEEGDVEDLELVKAANPLSAITVETLRDKRTRPTMTLNHWKRFTCNMPTRSDMAAITEKEWLEARGGGIAKGLRIWLGVDVGWKYDPTALVPFRLEHERDRRFGEAVILDPLADGSQHDLNAVLYAIAQIHERNPIEVIVMDISDARDVADWCETELGCSIVERGQGLKSQIRDYQNFMEALRNGWLTHSGDYGLTRHALNAVVRPLPLGDYVFARPVSSRLAKNQDQRRIDALVAAAMVHTVSLENAVGSVYDTRGVVAV